MKILCLLSLLTFTILFFSSTFGQIPRTISYQGVLTDTAGNPKSDGNYTFTFSLYENSMGVNAVWNEIKNLSTSSGLFSTLLGDQTLFSNSIKFDKPYWLGIKVGDDPELSPRTALTTAGYSFSSIISDTAKNIINGKVVKSINGLKDSIQLEGSDGTTVSTNGNKITISSSTANVIYSDWIDLDWNLLNDDTHKSMLISLDDLGIDYSMIRNQSLVLVYLRQFGTSSIYLMPTPGRWSNTEYTFTFGNNSVAVVGLLIDLRSTNGEDLTELQYEAFRCNRVRFIIIPGTTTGL